MLFGDDGTHCSARRTSRDDKTEKLSPFLKKFLRQSQSSTHDPEPKKAKFILFWHFRVESPSVEIINQIFISIVFSNTFNLQWSKMIFSVSSDGIAWSLDFGPDSAPLIVKVLVHETTISSREIPLAAWSLLLSQRQDFLNNHLTRVPVATNQQGTMEMRGEFLSNVGAQDMATSGHQLSDLDDVELYWKMISLM